MWQNPLLPPHLLVQALLLGSAILLPLAMYFELNSTRPVSIVLPLTWLLAISSLIHLLMIWGEVSLTHPTAHARLARPSHSGFKRSPRAMPRARSSA